MQVVMGIDPGAANLGFGIVRVEGNHMVALDGGVIETTPELPMERRLQRIHAELAELLAWHEPKAMAVEDVFFGKNAQTAMTVGRASGVAMLAAAQAGVGCFSYTPQAIKMAVCGSGAAGNGTPPGTYTSWFSVTSSALPMPFARKSTIACTSTS